MHELSVTTHILEIVLNEMKTGDYKKVNRIDMVIGDLSGIERENVRYYFKLLSENTPASKAFLTFKSKKSKFRCNSCGNVYERCNFSILCPRCNGRGTMVESSISLYIDSIEVE